MVRIICTPAPALAAVMAALCIGPVYADSQVAARGQQSSHAALTGAWDRYGFTAIDPRVTAVSPYTANTPSACPMAGRP
jgi:hypothetical protein